MEKITRRSKDSALRSEKSSLLGRAYYGLCQLLYHSDNLSGVSIAIFIKLDKLESLKHEF